MSSNPTNVTEVNLLENSSFLISKVPIKTAADDIFFSFSFFFSEKIRLDFSCKLPAGQMIHMKYQVLFSLKTLFRLLQFHLSHITNKVMWVNT